MKNSKIEWAHHTTGLGWGCTTVHESYKGLNKRKVNYKKRFENFSINVITEFTFDEKINRCLINSFSDFKGVQKVYEVADSHLFLELMLESLKQSPWSACVTLNSIEELNSVRKFITEDGSTGLTLSNDGTMGNGFSNPNYKRPFNLSQLLVLGVKEGAIMFDAFDTILPSYYSMFGFKAVARIPFNDEYKPLIKNGKSEKDWCFKQYEKFNNGRPDVIFFVYDGNNRNTIEDRIGVFKPFNINQKNRIQLFGKDEYNLAKTVALKEYLNILKTELALNKLSIQEDLKIRQYPKNHTLINNNNMKTTLKTALSKEERISINNTKCALALEKGYKYDRETGKIIGQRNKAINAQINGYTIISFLVDGKRTYLYGTTFIEYILKSENESISPEEIELAKTYVKPSTAYLAEKKALKEAQKQKSLVDVATQEIITDAPEVNLVDKSFSFNWKHMKFRKGVKKNRRQSRLMA
jgi:hypothetical protein